MKQVDRRRLMVLLVMAAQLLVLLVGLSFFESFLKRTLAESVVARSYESQRGAASMLAREFVRRGWSDVTPGSIHHGQAQELVATWHPEGGWHVSVVDADTGEIWLDGLQERVGQTQPGWHMLQNQSQTSVDDKPVLDDGNWVVAAPLPSLNGLLLVHAPVSEAVVRLEGMLTLMRAGGLLVAFVVASISAVVTWQLMRRYESHLRQVNASLEAKVQERTQQLERNRDAVIYAVAKVAEARDEGTGQHLERMAAYTAILAEALAEQRTDLEKDWAKVVSTTSILHDIGKVGIPDGVLLKPGKLTDEERQTIQKHALIGGQTLQAIRMQWGRDRFLDTAREIVLAHHERWDGTGYPRGIAGEQIPLSARIVAIADVYDALTSQRPYKQAMSHDEAAQRIRDGAGSHFDPALVDLFESISDRLDQARARLQDPPETASEVDQASLWDDWDNA